MGVEEVASFDIIDAWHIFILTKHNSTYFDVQIDDEVIYAFNLRGVMVADTEKVCVFSFMGGGDKFENLYGLNYNNAPPAPDTIDLRLLIAGAVLLTVAGVSISYKYSMKKS